MRVNESLRIPKDPSDEKTMEIIEKGLREASVAINSNAGSAEILEEIADLPAAAEVTGRFYFSLDSAELVFSDGTDWYDISMTVRP